MTRTRNKKHNEVLINYSKELQNQGKKVILLNEKSPDGIVIDWETKKVYALEVLMKAKKNIGQYKGKYAEKGKIKWGYQISGGFTFAMKRRIYSMFDNILFAVYYKDKDDIEFKS
ncbi:hypothetical protein LCGC14_1267820 [marine sediment metagenome]|uniref:Uncharacterized protein n=1 Tax=marine sediment metagenome TaxID=412755 RepID=A0A0F9LJW0_9ZZZZ